jgi:hypothetical protein
MTRGFTLGQLVYAIFYVVLYHGYFEKQKPYVSVNVLLAPNELVRRCVHAPRPRGARGR